MITRVKFKNCFGFKGENELFLGPLVYAITASYESEPDRSNFGGKSSLLRLLGPLPLYGHHGLEKEEDWITDGEDYAEVELEIDDGTIFRRWKQRGSSTQAEIEFPNGTKVGQKGFKARVEADIGLNEQDFFSSCFFRQKAVDAFITARPGDRQEMVTNWLGIEQMKVWEDKSRALVREAIGIEETIQRELNSKLQQKQEYEENYPDIDSQIETATTAVTTLQLRVEALKEQCKQLVTVQTNNLAYERIKRQQEDLVDQANEFKQGLARLNKPTDEAIAELERVAAAVSLRFQELRKQSQSLETLTRGEFDGSCPVSKGLQCPVKALINSDRAKHQTTYETVSNELLEASTAMKEASVSYKSALDLKRQCEELEGLVSKGRETYKRLAAELKKYSYTEITEDPSLELQEVSMELSAAKTKLKHLESVWNYLEYFNCTVISDLESKLESAHNHRRNCEDAADVFRASTKICAESGLEIIEEGANDLLQTAGIDLKVQARWNREGSTAARNCGRCGDPFPASTKIKQCARCGASRGNNLVERLDIVLSNYSGGGEDLAGLALQLSAAAWLRAQRGSKWNAALLDEITGALDSYNRKALATHIQAMLLGRYGFVQGFVIAHTKDVSEAFEGKIEIYVKKDGTRTVSVV